VAQLKNVNIQFTSLVDKAANKKQFCIIKSEDGNFEVYCPIIKVDTEKQEITAVVYEPLTKDAHNDEMTAEEIEKAQRSHMLQGAKSDLQHSFTEEKGLHTVESWITKEDCEIGGQPIKKGTWMETKFVEDANLWEGVKSGKYTGFSMGGIGERVEKSEEVIEKEEEFEDIKIKKSVFKKIADLLGLTDNKEEVLKEEKEEFTMDENKLQELINKSVTDAITKATQQQEVVKTEVAETEDEKITKAVEGAVNKVLKSLGLEEKEETLEDKVAKAIEKQLEPVKSIIEKMANARGISKTEEQVTTVKNEEPTIKKSYIQYK